MVPSTQEISDFNWLNIRNSPLKQLKIHDEEVRTRLTSRAVGCYHDIHAPS
jgi:hypothetical protein